MEKIDSSCLRQIAVGEAPVQPVEQIPVLTLQIGQEFQWRKLCFGNQSDDGDRFSERILTVTRTCQLQGKNPFHFLADLMEAAFKGLTRPSLLN